MFTFTNSWKQVHCDCHAMSDRATGGALGWGTAWLRDFAISGEGRCDTGLVYANLGLDGLNNFEGL
jgi:hypothetical protein